MGSIGSIGSVNNISMMQGMRQRPDTTKIAELVADTAQMNIDAPIEALQWPAQPLLRKIGLAHRLAGISRQGFKEIEFGAGEIERNPCPLDTPLCGVYGPVSYTHLDVYKRQG